MSYIISRYFIKPEAPNLMDILLGKINENSFNLEAKFVPRVYQYNKFPNSKKNMERIENYIQIMEQFAKHNKDLIKEFTKHEYDYELQVNLTSRYKKVFSNENLSEVERDKKIKDKVVEELAANGKKYCELYKTFFIPKKKKKNGQIKWRRIDAPQEHLKQAQTDLKRYIEILMDGLTYHTSAFAYIRGRSIKDASMKHQKHNSRWYLKLDFSDFFGSVNMEFTYNMLSQIFPFSEMVKIERGEKVIKDCLQICFLEDKLPQGTPISPMLTNLIMVPIDYTITNNLYNKYNAVSPSGNRHAFVYTRYADDILISNRVDFKTKYKNGKKYSNVVDKDGNRIDIEDFIIKVLKRFNTPLKLNKDKTKYTSVNGSNWSLGLLINRDNEISLGHERRDILSAKLWDFANRCTREEICKIEAQQIYGLYNYHKQIEEDKAKKIMDKTSSKIGFDIEQVLLNIIKSKSEKVRFASN